MRRPHIRVDSPTRIARCLGFLVYCIGIIAWAASGPDPIDAAEWTAILLASVAIIGLLAHATTKFSLPGEHYAYLMTGFAGATSAMLYVVDMEDTGERNIYVTLLLIAPSLLSYGAYLTMDVEGRGVVAVRDRDA